MKFFEELKQLEEVREQCLSEVKKIENEKNMELEQINQKYLNLSKSTYEKLKEQNDKIYSYYLKLEEYSNFYLGDIGNILADLIGIFEGKDYVYQRTYYNRYGYQYELVQEFVTMIVQKNEYKKFYNDKEFYALKHEGKSFVLLNNKQSDYRISFYKVNKEEYSLIQNVDWEKFDYVQEFINEVILYKISQNSKDISLEELKKLEIDFVLSQIEQIERKLFIKKEKLQAV